MQNFPLSNCKVGENFAYPRGRQNLIFVNEQNLCSRQTGCAVEHLCAQAVPQLLKMYTSEAIEPFILKNRPRQNTKSCLRRRAKLNYGTVCAIMRFR